MACLGSQALTTSDRMKTYLEVYTSLKFQLIVTAVSVFPDFILKFIFIIRGMGLAFTKNIIKQNCIYFFKQRVFHCSGDL